MWKLQTQRLLWNLRWRRRLVVMELGGQARLVAARLRPVWRSLLALRRRRHFVPILIIGSLVLAGAAAAALVPVLSGRTAPPVYTMTAATDAVAAARASGAAEWAPRAYSESRALLDRGVLEYRLQGNRLLFRRDFGLSRTLLLQAETRARAAQQEAVQRREGVAARARRLLGRATEMVGISRSFARLMPLQPQERRKLARSRLALLEAAQRFRAGEHSTSAELAAMAESLASDVSAGCSVRASRFEDPRLLRHWRAMIDETIRWSHATGGTAIVVRKTEHTLTLYRAGVARLTCRTDIGTNTVADKSFSGDYATPEGRYKIVAKRGLGETTYYKALMLDYPNGEDLERFRRERRAGRIRARGPGGDIEIHGEGGRYNDWTKGCVAITNREMDMLFAAVEIGTPVTIVGSGDGSHPFADLIDRYRANAEKRKS